MNPFAHMVAQMQKPVRKSATEPKRDGSKGGRTREEQSEIDYYARPNVMFPKGSGSGRAYVNTRAEMDEAARLITLGYTSKRIAELTPVRYNAVRVMKIRVSQGKTPYNLNGKFAEDKVNKDG